MKTISLLAWSKLHGITYSTAQKMNDRGEIAGATRVGGRITVPEDSLPPEREMITCLECGREMPQITGTHLKAHKMTIAEYRAAHPGAPTSSNEVNAKIVDRLTGIVRSEETRKRVSEGRKGIIPKDHPRFVKGAYSPSAEARANMAAAQTGRIHTEETKRKIGNANLGHVKKPETLIKASESMKRWHEANNHPALGKVYDANTRATFSAGATMREANYSPEKKAELAEKRAQKTRGIKRTPEQKVRYRDARQKFMSENPWTLKETRGELALKSWMDENDVRYTQQFMIPNVRHVYDFFLPDYNAILEFDGAHHWAHIWFKTTTRTQEELDQALLDQMARDAYYNMMAGIAGYRIIRVCGYALPGDSEHGSLEDQLRIQGLIE